MHNTRSVAKVLAIPSKEGIDLRVTHERDRQRTPWLLRALSYVLRPFVNYATCLQKLQAIRERLREENSQAAERARVSLNCSKSSFCI